MKNKIAEKLGKLFVNRDDVYAEAYLSKDKKRMAYAKKQNKVDRKLILEHFNQKKTIGVYQLKEEKVKWACLDFDLNTLEDFDNAKKLFFKLKQEEKHPLPELSGGGIYKCHIWIFCDCKAEDIKNYLEDICEKIKVMPHEIFPKQIKASDKLPYGNLVKLPLGLHLVTKAISVFLDDNFNIMTSDKIIERLDYHLKNIDKIPKIIIKEKVVTQFKTEEKKASELDFFMNFVINNELPAGKTAEEKKYQKIIGVNDNILKNLAIWFFKKGYSLDRLEKEIKPTYDKRNWAFGDLKGWFKKAEQGDITKINIGEIAEWCRTYREDLLGLLPQDNQEEEIIEEEIKIKENPFKKLHYATQHLTHFSEFNKLLGLYGRHYLPLKKARWYQLLGGIMQKKITRGMKELDTRISCIYPLPTEAGKNDFIYLFKDVVCQVNKSKEHNFKIEEPTSFHPEQLIGKVIEIMIDNPKYLSGEVKKPKTIKVKKENRGYFNSDFVEFDEANALFFQEDEQIKQAREYISKSLNPIGRNEVVKKLVGDLPQERVSYNPKCTITLYFQPKKMKEELLLQGFLRRFLIPVGSIEPFLNYGKEEDFRNKISTPDFSKQELKETLVKYLEEIRISLQEKNFVFEGGAEEKLNYYLQYLIAEGQVHSERIANLTKLMKWTIQDYLIKMSCIIAGSFYQNIVTEDFVALAYMDLIEFLQSEFDFIKEWVVGDFDYGIAWKGADYNSKNCLEYLYENKCFSLETSTISISNFWDYIQQIYNIKRTRSRQIYGSFKKNGWIGSKQIDRYKSKVWLTFKPQIENLTFQGDKGVKGVNLYESVFSTINTILEKVTPLSPPIPLIEKIDKNQENEPKNT